jgi:hypothetical protein
MGAAALKAAATATVLRNGVEREGTWVVFIEHRVRGLGIGSCRRVLVWGLKQLTNLCRFFEKILAPVS